MVGIEARIEIAEVDEAVDQKPGADEQQERDGHFSDNEQTAQTIAPSTHTRIAGTLLQILVEIEPGSLRHGGEAKNQPGEQTDESGKTEHLSVDRDPLREGDRGGDELLQHVESEEREKQPHCTARGGEEQAFGKELPDEAGAGRAERQPKGDFLLSHGGPRQEQIGDVGTGDKEHERNGAEKD